MEQSARFVQIPYTVPQLLRHPLAYPECTDGSSCAARSPVSRPVRPTCPCSRRLPVTAGVDTAAPPLDISDLSVDTATADALVLNDLAASAPDDKIVPAFDAQRVRWDIDVETYSSHPRAVLSGILRRGGAQGHGGLPPAWRPVRADDPATLRGQGLPGDLGYLALIESGYSNEAVIRAYAVGMWQFMRVTGRGYGLRVDSWVDERRDPVKATDAAARHLRIFAIGSAVCTSLRPPTMPAQARFRAASASCNGIVPPSHSPKRRSPSPWQSPTIIRWPRRTRPATTAMKRRMRPPKSTMLPAMPSSSGSPPMTCWPPDPGLCAELHRLGADREGAPAVRVRRSHGPAVRVRFNSGHRSDWARCHRQARGD